MEATRPAILRPAMTYGLIIALVIILLAVSVWILGLEGAGWMQWINWAAYFIVLYFCLKNWRDHYNGGYIRYGQSLSAGIAGANRTATGMPAALSDSIAASLAW